MKKYEDRRMFGQGVRSPKNIQVEFLEVLDDGRKEEEIAKEYYERQGYAVAYFKGDPFHDEDAYTPVSKLADKLMYYEEKIGAPDLIVFSREDYNVTFFFVEVKRTYVEKRKDRRGSRRIVSDGIREEQMRWACDHNDTITRFLWVRKVKE